MGTQALRIDRRQLDRGRMYTVRSLRGYHLRRWQGDIQGILEEIQSLRLSTPADAYVEAQARTRSGPEQKDVLTFEQAGAVTRLLISIIGKPTAYVMQEMHLRNTGHRHLKSPKNVFKVTWKALPLQQAVDLCNLLKYKGYSIGMSNKGVLELLFPEDTPPSCFFTSEEPEVWKKKQEQKKLSKQVSKVARKLDRKP